jgi:integrase/recombinase XerC
MDTLDLASIQQRFLTYQRARNHSPKQLAHYEQTFRHFARFLHIENRPATADSLRTATFEAFVVWLRETPLARPYRGSYQRAETGIWGHTKDLRAFVKWCSSEEQDFITWKVTVPMPKLGRELFPILRDEQLVALWQSPMLAGKGEMAVRNRAMVSLMLDTGIRLGELAGLKKSSIVGMQYVQVLGKGHRERLCPFSSAALVYLVAWLKLRDELHIPEDEPLFLLRYRGIQQFFKCLSVSLGYSVHAHLLRHQAATALICGNTDLDSVARILGHAQLSTVQLYSSLSNEDLAVKHAAASPFGKLQELLPEGSRPRRRLKAS